MNSSCWFIDHTVPFEEAFNSAAMVTDSDSPGGEPNYVFHDDEEAARTWRNYAITISAVAGNNCTDEPCKWGVMARYTPASLGGPVYAQLLVWQNETHRWASLEKVDLSTGNITVGASFSGPGQWWIPDEGFQVYLGIEAYENHYKGFVQGPDDPVIIDATFEGLDYGTVGIISFNTPTGRSHGVVVDTFDVIQLFRP